MSKNAQRKARQQLVQAEREFVLTKAIAEAHSRKYKNVLVHTNAGSFEHQDCNLILETHIIQVVTKERNVIYMRDKVTYIDLEFSVEEEQADAE